MMGISSSELFLPRYVEQGHAYLTSKLHHHCDQLEGKRKVAGIFIVELLSVASEFLALPLQLIETLACGAIQLVGLALGKKESKFDLLLCVYPLPSNIINFILSGYILHLPFLRFLVSLHIGINSTLRDQKETALNADFRFHQIAAQRCHGFDIILRVGPAISRLPLNRQLECYRELASLSSAAVPQYIADISQEPSAPHPSIIKQEYSAPRYVDRNHLYLQAKFRHMCADIKDYLLQYTQEGGAAEAILKNSFIIPISLANGAGFFLTIPLNLIETVALAAIDLLTMDFSQKEQVRAHYRIHGQALLAHLPPLGFSYALFQLEVWREVAFMVSLYMFGSFDLRKSGFSAEVELHRIGCQRNHGIHAVAAATKAIDDLPLVDQLVCYRALEAMVTISTEVERRLEQERFERELQPLCEKIERFNWSGERLLAEVTSRRQEFDSLMNVNRVRERQRAIVREMETLRDHGASFGVPSWRSEEQRARVEERIRAIEVEKDRIVNELSLRFPQRRGESENLRRVDEEIRLIRQELSRTLPQETH